MQSAVILVVEDERLVARDIADILGQRGYVVPTICATAEAAIAAIQLSPPDLVLMDIRLAGDMDGVKAAQIIQAEFGLPVVYLTANADAPTLDRVHDSRPFGYVLKPFDELTLTTTIEIALSRHRAEREIRSALKTTETLTQQAQAQVEQKLQYFAMAAHELRNPLGVIQSVAELLSMPNLNLPADRRDRYLNRMQAATASMDDLLRSILTYSYSSAGKLDTHPKQLDLVTFCQEQIEMLQTSIGQHHQFRFTPEAIGSNANPTTANPTTGNNPTCTVWLDEQLLWHLLTNLLSNAIKYSPAPPDPIGQVDFHLTWNADRLWISVSDNGIGIPIDAEARLFEPFYRADNTGEIPGTGLGLALVKQCVERQGGTVGLKRLPDRPMDDRPSGACFVIELPRDARSDLEL
jgi:signal transduction histidine kinase